MLVTTTESLPSKTHPVPISFFGDVRLLSTELEVVVKCIPAKNKSNLQRIVDSVHRANEGLQQENVVKPLVVEKSAEAGKREVRVATPLAAASLEELLDQVEEASTAEPPSTESVLNDLSLDWNLDARKDVALQLLRGMSHLHKKFGEKADGGLRYFTNLKASNVLLFSRGAHGGVNVKLSDFFCFPVRSKDELSATLTEKFGQVPEMKDLGDALDVNQWNIIDAEVYVAGLLLQRLIPNDNQDLRRLVASLTHPEASRRVSAASAANHPVFWSSKKKISFISRFIAALDFRRKGLKDAIRNARLDHEKEQETVEAFSWADTSQYGIDTRLLEELGKKRKGGYEMDNLLGLVEFMQDVGKQLARPTRVLAPLMEELFPSSTNSPSDALAEYFVGKFPRLPERLLPICAELPAMKEFIVEELQRFEIPTAALPVDDEEEDEEEDEVEEQKEAPSVESTPLAPSFANFRPTSRQSNSDEEEVSSDSASLIKAGVNRIPESSTEFSVASVSPTTTSLPTCASQIDADIDALTSMWSQGAGSITEDNEVVAEVASASPATTANNVDDLSDLLAGFGVADREPQHNVLTVNLHQSSAQNVLNAIAPTSNANKAVVDPSIKESLDLTSLSEALVETEKKSDHEKTRKTTLAIILTAKEQLESKEVDEALEALEDVDMTYELLLETKIGLALRAAKKEAQDDETKKACADLIAKWKTLLLDQVGKENEDKKKKTQPPKKKANYQFLPETATTDEVRLKSRKLILDALMERNEDAPSTKIAKNIAARVEETIFQTNKADIGQKYRSAIRSRVFNLRDSKNPELGDDVVDGSIRPEAFALMTAEEMASKDMKRLREQLQQEANRTERVLHSPRNLFLTRW